ncbi:hypothetical protein [Ileibacterium valens]|nr:hypothetical protein [Ileibacterium valens]
MNKAYRLFIDQSRDSVNLNCQDIILDSDSTKTDTYGNNAEMPLFTSWS